MVRYGAKVKSTKVATIAAATHGGSYKTKRWNTIAFQSTGKPRNELSGSFMSRSAQ